MIAKLAGHDDLFAYDAKYHKQCYSHYISNGNIKSHQRTKRIKLSPSSVSIHENNSCIDESTLESASSSSEYDDNDDNEHVSNNKDMSDMQILHRAAAILRKAMNTFNVTKNEFPAPNTIKKSEFSNQVPNILLLFTSWLIDAKSFEKVRYHQTYSLD